MNLIMQKRGQITLPSSIRKKFGLEEGQVLQLEEREGEIILKPGVVLGMKIYSDEQIAEWDQDDKWDPELAKRVREALRRRK